MNGRTLLASICVLFVIGIIWMIGVIPEEETPRTGVSLFEPLTPAPREETVATRPTAPSEEKEATAPKQETIASAEKKEPTIEKPKTGEAVSDEPPEVVAYTPAYGSVTFTHMKHIDDYEIDCGDCHHEDMEGGMSKCVNCHEPPKNALHKNCTGCHKELKGEGKKTGPIKCQECHIKTAAKPTAPSEEKEATAPKQETIASAEKKEPTIEKPKTGEAVSDEPPEVVAYTPAYGSVTFTHMKHIDDYEIDCGDCHHEDMEGGMSKCVNCHEPPKNALHKNCTGCHKELKGEGKKTGPIKCRECHIKTAA